MADIVSDTELEALLGPESVSYKELNSILAHLPSDIREIAKNSLSSKGFFPGSSIYSDQSETIHSQHKTYTPEGPNIDELFLDITYESDGATGGLLQLGSGPLSTNISSNMPHVESTSEERHSGALVPKNSDNLNERKDINTLDSEGSLDFYENTPEPSPDGQNLHTHTQDIANNAVNQAKIISHDVEIPLTVANNHVTDQNESSSYAYPGECIQTEPKEHVGNPQEEEENAHHLKAYLGGVSQATRRGLRHRTFTNAHPYLADSAQWMGLASTEVLNEMFEQNQDVELIVKALNTQYIKKKKRYPKDYKFRSKNFYAFLGNVRKSQMSAQNEEAFNASQDLSSPNPSSQIRSPKSLQIEDEFPYGELAGEEFHDPENDIDGAESLANELIDLNDTYTTLHGSNYETEVKDNTFESDLTFFDRPKRSRRQKPSVLDLRKDLQLRQRKAYLQHDIGSFSDNEDQVDLNSQIQLHSNSFEVPYSSADRFFMRSQFQDDTQYFEPPESVNLSKSAQDSRIPLASEESETEVDIPIGREIFDGLLDVDTVKTPTLPENYFDFEVQEMDRVDPMFAYSRAPKLSSKVGVSKRENAAMGLKRNRMIRSNGIQLAKLKKTSIQSNTPNADISRSQYRGFVKNKRKRVASDLRIRHKHPRVSSLTLPLSHLTSTNNLKSLESKRTPLAPINSNVLQLTTKSVKEIMNDAYSFSRKPISSTTVVESESLQKFILPVNYKLAGNETECGFFLSSDCQFKEISDMNFPDTFIFSKFQSQKIHLLRFGYTAVISNDAAYCILLGESYSFLLLNKVTSKRTFSKLLHHLHRIFVESPSYLKTPSVEAEIYRAISTAIEWALILQDKPEETSWRILHSLLTNFEENTSHLKVKIMYIPYFLLLWFILKQILERSPSKEDTELSRVKYSNKFLYLVASKYFKVLLQNYSAEELKSKLVLKSKLPTFQLESLYAIYFIFSNDSMNHWWWGPIEEAVILIANTISFEPSDTLEQLLLVASLVPVKRAAWNPFYAIYRYVGTEPTSYIHETFLRVALQLKDRYQWVIEEKLITTIYNGIAARKFADFCNEATESTSAFFSSELLGRLSSRDSIPNSTFFGKFMFLLFSYVSDLPLGANKKRLISKLLPSSQYTYGQDSKSFGIFINRTNFVLLLLHISNLDLRGQFNDLMRAVSTNTNDIQFLLSACRACDLYSEIAIEKQLDVPTNSYSDIMNRTALLYDVSKHHQFLELWSNFEYQIIRKFLGEDCSPKYVASALDIIQHIDIQILNDKLIAGYLKLVMRCLRSTSASDSVTPITEKVVSIIQTRMGKLPQLKIEDENKIDMIVELGLRVLIICYNCTPSSSWNELIFQKYPYLGNLYLRNKYVIFFYNELLEFLNISEHLDTYVVAFLLILTPGSQSKYQTAFFNRLRGLNEPVFHFKNEPSLPVFISKLHFNMIRPSIASHFIENLMTSSTFSNKTKEYFMKEYVTLLLKCAKDLNLMKDSYKKYIDTIEKWGLKYVKDFPMFRSLTRNLGLQHFEVDRIAWSQLSLQERLRIIHADVLAGMKLKQDCFMVLDKYITVDEFELIYHLISLYLKSIVALQHEKWILLYILLEYVNSKLSECAVNLTDGSLKAFLRLLTDLGSLKNISSRSNYFMFELLAFESALKIFSTAFKIHDGYKDTHQMVDTIEMFVNNCKHANSASSDTKLLNHSFTSLRLYDVHIAAHEMTAMGADLNIQLGDSIPAIKHTNKQDIDNANAYQLHKLDQCIQNLHELTRVKETTCTLEFDL